MVSKEEFDEWLRHPVTQDMRRAFAARREMLKDAWANRDFTEYTIEATTLSNIFQTGECRAYAEIIEVSYETLEGALQDEK